MPEGSLTLRVKVLGSRDKEHPLDLEVSAGKTCQTRTLAGVSPRRQMVAFRRQLGEIACRDSPREVLCGRSCSRVSCKGLVGPRV